MASSDHAFNSLGICTSCGQITGREDEMCKGHVLGSMRDRRLREVAETLADDWFTIAPKHRTRIRLTAHILQGIEHVMDTNG